MEWLTDPGDRKGLDRVVYRAGNVMALLVVAAVVAAPVALLLVLLTR